MSDINLVYQGQFDRTPFFGGMYWFDKGVPMSIRGDLAAQLLFTTVNGVNQFQVASQTEFEQMLADGYIAPGTSPDGLVWTPPQVVAPVETVIAPTEPITLPATDEAVLVETVDASDAPATDEAAPRSTGRRRGTSA